MNYDKYFSSRVKGLSQSGIRKYFDLLNDLEGGISLGVGEPDFITPEGEVVSNGRLTVAPPPARSYAYMTDTLYREKFADYVKGVDLLYHEATYGKESEVLAKESFHSTAEQAACLARLAGAGKLLLGHFSARYPDPCCLLPEAQALFPNTCVCSDGDVYEVPAVKRLV